MEVNIAAVIVLAVFYLLILAVGLVAAWKVKVKDQEGQGLEESVVAGRELSTFVGILSMVATTVGGGYINGTAESIASGGLVWTLAPLGIFLGLNLGGLFFARRMRNQNYLTMLDPFQVQYSKMIVCFIYLATLMGDMLWSASILNALGTTLSVVADIPLTLAVIVSGAITVIYTMIGSIISVAYTDIVQLLFIAVGLTVSLPYVLTNKDVGSFSESSDVWLGQLESGQTGFWIDLLIAMTLGTIPWQAYFQRVLSVKSASQAQVLSFVGAFGAVLFVVPSLVIGMAGASADWSNTTLGESPVGTNLSTLILPLVIEEFTPQAISILGLGAISAAVMSSMDSSVLGTSSMFTHNIYNGICHTQASQKQLRFVQMAAVVVFGAVAVIIALTSSVIYGMFILAADLVYVIIFPQLTAVLYFPSYTNSWGAAAGYFLSLFLRIGAGEPILKLDPWYKLPMYDDKMGQLFPYRTTTMLLSMLLIVLVTWITNRSFLQTCGSRVSAVVSYKLLKKVHVSVSEGNVDGDVLKKNDATEKDNVCEKNSQTVVSKRTGEVVDDFEMGALVNGTFHKLENGNRL